MAIPNDQYWQQRFDRMKEDALVYTNTVVARIVKDYGKALAQVRKELAAWFQRFMDNNTITEINKALELLNGDELKELKWTLEEYIAKGKANAHDPRWIKELENASAKVHITRLQALELLIRQQSEDLHAKLQDHTQESMGQIYQDTYSHTAFEIQKGIGIGLEMGRGIDAQELDKIIHRPWASDGLDFSKRIWNDRDKLNQRLHRELTNMALTGDGPDKAINRIAKEFETDKRNAARLVQTEHAAMESAAHKDCFNDLGVEQYKFIATLDLKTSEICRGVDSKIFPMSKYKVGETAPPMHPRCRSTTAPYFEDVADLGERWARGADGRTYSVPGNMTYEEWVKQQEKIHSAVSVDRSRKKTYNSRVDRNQFEKYKEQLGQNAPQSLTDFQDIKYSDDWEAFKFYAKAVKSGELTPLADFSLYKQISNEIDDKLVGIVAANGVTIAGKSWHFISRVIGSVEQKRNGVSVDSIVDALLDPDDLRPVKVSKSGKKSQRMKKGNVLVTVNPDSGNLIQANPLSGSNSSHGGKKQNEYQSGAD
jgi:SPP1 gp7 family putative phage head morphogenesis protein